MSQVTLDGGGTGAGGTVTVPARTLIVNPLSVAGPLLYLSAPNTDGYVLAVQADGTLAWEAGGGGGGAPTDAEYIVGAVHAGLSAERVVTDNGDITWDKATAGQLKALIAALGVTTGKIADDAVNFAKTGFYLGEFAASAANDFDIALPSGYQGQDTMGYVIEMEALAASAAFGDILLNNTDTVDTKLMQVHDGVSTPTDAGANGPYVIGATERCWVRIVVHLRDGGVRLVRTEIIGVFGANWRRYVGWGRWADTTTDITSLRFRLDGAVNWDTSTKARVWAF